MTDSKLVFALFKYVNSCKNLQKMLLDILMVSAFPVFNVLETCREYLLTIDRKIVEFIKKIYRAVF